MKDLIKKIKLYYFTKQLNFLNKQLYFHQRADKIANINNLLVKYLVELRDMKENIKEEKKLYDKNEKNILKKNLLPSKDMINQVYDVLITHEETLNNIDSIYKEIARKSNNHDEILLKRELTRCLSEFESYKESLDKISSYREQIVENENELKASNGSDTQKEYIEKIILNLKVIYIEMILSYIDEFYMLFSTEIIAIKKKYKATNDMCNNLFKIEFTNKYFIICLIVLPIIHFYTK